jgi:alkylated DNA repair dioxygenase AlkB
MLQKRLSIINYQLNLLPHNGTAYYHSQIFDNATTHAFFEDLLTNIHWQHDEVVMFGKHIITARKVAWYADNGITYTYSKTTKTGLAWTDTLLNLKAIAEKLSGVAFNSCLLNLYHNGNEGMGWHSDDEKTIVANSPIASFSFGVERKFMFKHKQTKETVSVLLENGSCLLMKDETQTHWLHSLPKSTKITEPRVNLTFRVMKTA